MSKFRIKSEWDFGWEDMIFDSKEAALEHMKQDENLKELCDDYQMSVDEIMAKNLISFVELKEM